MSTGTAFDPVSYASPRPGVVVRHPEDDAMQEIVEARSAHRHREDRFVMDAAFGLEDKCRSSLKVGSP